MKLKPQCLNLIKDVDSRRRLGAALKCSDQTIVRYLKENDDNLTKAASLVVIRDITGLSDEDILEKESEEVRA